MRAFFAVLHWVICAIAFDGLVAILAPGLDRLNPGLLGGLASALLTYLRFKR